MTPPVACSDFLDQYQRELTDAARARQFAAAEMTAAKQRGDSQAFNFYRSLHQSSEKACIRLASAILRVLEPLA